MANSVDPDQTESDQGLHCLPVSLWDAGHYGLRSYTYVKDTAGLRSEMLDIRKCLSCIPAPVGPPHSVQGSRTKCS